jgi:toxin ParE1/3/4
LQYHITATADNDLDELAQYIAQDNLDAAFKLYDKARESFETLAANPFIGNQYPALSTELKNVLFFPVKDFPKYLIFYLPENDQTIIILRILHGSRNIKTLFS